MAKLILAEVLKRKQITKYRFAKLLGKPYASVFRYFRKGIDPKLSTIMAWAKALDVEVTELIKE